MTEVSQEAFEGSTLDLPNRAALRRPEDGTDSAFSDIEGERLFKQLRGQMFARGEAMSIGRYRIVSRLGAGAMGEVHLAHDESLDRAIAIKFVHAHLTQPRFAEALHQEARALARLAHPNVVHIYEVGEFRGRVFLAMEYVKGRSVREWIRARSPSWREVLEAYLAAARGLAAAHSAGVVHRDFKPDNILRGDDGRIAVADFGLAALEHPGTTIDEDPDVTLTEGARASDSRSGTVKGTPAYMPPEQLRGFSDNRSDQFALCVALYEGLWGRRPFPDRALSDLLAGAIDWTPQLPPQRSAPPKWLWPILRRGLARDPDDRWASVDALIAALELGLSRRRRRTRVFGSGLVALGVGLASGVAGVWWSSPAGDCASFELELDGTWDDARREQLESVLDQAGAQPGTAWLRTSSAALLTKLDGWRERWLESRSELCLARAGGDPVVLARHDACLEHQRLQLQATVDLLVARDSEPARELATVVQAMPDPRRCAVEARRGGPPAPPAQLAPRVEALRDELALVKAELSTARYDAALARVDSVQVRASVLAHAPLNAEIASSRGAVLLAIARREDGYTQLEAAADLAEGAHHDHVVTESWLRMARTAAVHEPELERAHRWLRRARAAAARIGLDPIIEARLGVVEGHLAMRAKQPERAITQLERAREIFIEQGDLPESAFASTSIGLACFEQGDRARGIAELQHGLELLEQLYGPAHPELANAAYDLGQLLHQSQPAFARELLERAVEIWTAAESPRPGDLGRAQFVLAQFELDAGEFETGLELAHAAAKLFEQHLDADDIAHAEVAILMGTANYFLAHPEAAVSAYRRGVAGYAAAYGERDVYTAYFRVALGWALLAAHEPVEARAAFTSGREAIEAVIGAGTEESVDARLGLVAVELAEQQLEQASARLEAFGAPPVDDMNQLCFALMRGLAQHRHDARSEDALAALRRAGQLARGIGGGEATLEVLLASVDASARERALASPAP